MNLSKSLDNFGFSKTSNEISVKNTGAIWKDNNSLHFYHYNYGGEKKVIRLHPNSAFPDWSILIFLRNSIQSLSTQYNTDRLHIRTFSLTVLSIPTAIENTLSAALAEDGTYLDLFDTYFWDDIILLGKGILAITVEDWY